MDEPKVMAIVNEMSNSGKRRFLLFIIMSMIVSSVLVVVSMQLYNSSGAAQLDLSRPGYISVRSQAMIDNSDFGDYSSTGSINQSAITEFKSLYKKQAQKTKAVDAFGGDPLSAKALGLN